MSCPRCQNPQVLKESVGGGNIRSKCQKCGWTEVTNDKGKQLLTGDHSPPYPSPQILLEG